MRRRSFATAVVCVLPLFSLPTAGSAQSVLERVLGQVENSTNLAPVNGVYANIAESVSEFQPAQAVTEPYTLATIDASFDPPGNDILGVIEEPGFEGLTSPWVTTQVSA